MKSLLVIVINESIPDSFAEGVGRSIGHADVSRSLGLITRRRPILHRLGADGSGGG